ncbi:hypothetical protein RIF29_04441 [Crotalaria pallida]|uniref:Uncharacterized protein n=1 Tax=Crotalaria pallida TaxID=3830 RepID=A0AAN9J185_CROPI
MRGRNRGQVEGKLIFCDEETEGKGYFPIYEPAPQGTDPTADASIGGQSAAQPEPAVDGSRPPTELEADGSRPPTEPAVDGSTPQPGRKRKNDNGNGQPKRKRGRPSRVDVAADLRG